MIKGRIVAKDFNKGEKDRDDLFAETLPLEARRVLVSRASTRRTDGQMRQVMLIDAKKAHLNAKCQGDVYVRLPPECGCPEGSIAKLNYRLYGMRPAAVNWENFYAPKLEEKGFRRGEACGVSFYNPEMDVALAVHGDDFNFADSSGI